MKVTVITPFYEGDEYIDAYVQCMMANADSLARLGHELQVILVNDSPWRDLRVNEAGAGRDIFQVLVNEANSGIHYSRVAGLKAAEGDYIMFLDQDDVIAEDGLARLLRAAAKSGADVTVANAYLEQADGSRPLWYRTDYHKGCIGDLQTYIRIGIQIISPGQCLIKRGAIPDFWCQHILKQNGADDYFLWLIMLSDGARFDYLDEAIYTHKYTAKNLSADTTVTDDSAYEFMEYLGDYPGFTQEDLHTLHSMITYKNQFRASGLIGKAGASLANLGLFIDNIRFKKKTNTGYGFNR